MPSPSAVLPIMEGMVGYLTDSTAGGQEVNVWVEALKAVLRASFSRDETDFQFVLVDDIVNAADVVDTAATHVIGMLVGQDASDAERDWVAILDADSGTFLGDSILGNDNLVLVQPAAAATNNTEEYVGVVLVPFLALATGLSIGADGRDGTAPAANDLRAWVLYRN